MIAQYKIGAREILSQNTGACVLVDSRPSNLELSFGTGQDRTTTTIPLPVYNDQGDPISSDDLQSVFDAIQTIVQEHNAGM